MLVLDGSSPSIDAISITHRGSSGLLVPTLPKPLADCQPVWDSLSWVYTEGAQASTIRIGLRGTEHGSGLGTQRWVVERAFAHLRRFRRPRIRWELRDDIHEAFLALGCARSCRRRLSSFR